MINHIKPGDYIKLFTYLEKEYHVICYVDSLFSQSLPSQTNTKYRTKYWKLITVEYGIKLNRFVFTDIPEKELELITDKAEIDRLDKIRVFK